MTKIIQSQPPDVVVSVGWGESAKEFRCYSVVLSFASKYLDTMLSLGMKQGGLGRIDFPDMDPEEWQLFYELITPHPVGKMNTMLNESNATTLLPWFHQFQMHDCVKACDKVITESLIAESSHPEPHMFWPVDKLQDETDHEHEARLEQRKVQFGTVVGLLQIAHGYGLASTKDLLERRVVEVMTLHAQTRDLFDFHVVQSLVQLILPLELNGDKTGLRMSGGSESKHLWPVFEKIIAPHLSSLSQETLDDRIHFPLLFHSYVQIKIEREIARAEARAELLNTLIDHFPEYLYDQVPRHLTDAEARDYCRILLAEYGEQTDDCRLLHSMLPK